ncbi:MAG TPA: hypothetical protein VGG28_13625 [Kofleriaceae bacterium]
MSIAIKAWRESRSRFVIACFAIAFLAAVFVLAETTFRARMIAVGGSAMDYKRFIDLRIFTGITRAAYLLFAVVLALGGFVRERSQGTLAFTLALPIPRSHHVIARAAVGVAQLVILSMIPAVIVIALSPEPYPAAAALAWIPSWILAATWVFSAALVCSIVIPNEYGALAIGVVGLRLVARISLPSAVLATTAVAMIALAIWLGSRERFRS